VIIVSVSAAVIDCNESRLIRGSDDASNRGGANDSVGGGQTVNTVFGAIKGYATSDALIWKGIPFAKPPVGALRWKAPVDPDSWTGVRTATSPCNVCIQQVTDKFWRASNAFTGSEDCLCLDIYRPLSKETGLPVFVWIHGGANVLGSAQLFDGTTLAKRGNMIVVIIQYRLEMLGWLTHSALRASGTAQDKSGNYGTLDTMKALAWVQNNIAAFGGDPANVTVGGQSAGGAHVMNLLISPLTTSFQRAFAESPALSAMMPLKKTTDGDEQTNLMIDYMLKKDGVAKNIALADTYRAKMTDAQIEEYLRGKSADEILWAAIGGPGYGFFMPAPTAFMDGTVLPKAGWLDVIRSGKFKKVPLIIGNTQYEFKDLMTLLGTALRFFLEPKVPSGSHSWLSLYDVLDGTTTLNEVLPTANDTLEYEETGLLKSRKWLADCHALAREIKANNAANEVFSYLFTWAGGGDPALKDFKFIFGASHAQDIPFFFGDNIDFFKGHSFTSANRAGRVALQEAMMDYLAAFVKTGDPNPAGSTLPTWTQWSNEKGAAKFVTFDANLSNYLIGMDQTETTEAMVAAEINKVVTTHPEYKELFNFEGIQILPY
jgi:Carboxylesterase type B